VGKGEKEKTFLWSEGGSGRGNEVPKNRPANAQKHEHRPKGWGGGWVAGNDVISGRKGGVITGSGGGEGFALDHINEGGRTMQWKSTKGHGSLQRNDRGACLGSFAR